MATKKQVKAAKRNVGKAQAGAQKKRSIANMPAKTRSALGKQGAAVAQRKRSGGSSPKTRQELYEIAKQRDLPGRSKMGRAVLQDQAYIRALAVDFFISLLNTVDGWAERTLAEIEGWKDLSPDGKNDRGLEIIAQLPTPTPPEHTDRTPVPPRTQRRRSRSHGT